MSIVFLIFSAMMGACKPQTEFSPETDLSRTNGRYPFSTPANPEAAIDYRELSQEDLAALIYETAVDIETTAKAATDVLSNGVLTDEEISKTAKNMHALQAAIQLTNELVEVYASLYSEIAHETTDSLLAINRGFKRNRHPIKRGHYLHGAK